VVQLTANPKVQILNSRTVKRINFDAVNNVVSSVGVADAGGTETTFGDNQDHYIAAVPVEVVQKDATLFTSAFKLATGLSKPTTAAAGPDGVDKLRTEWMSGVLFYLNRDVSAVHGHVIYANSRWALTSISQRQFWGPGYPWAMRGNGQAQDILSTIISDWDRTGNKTTTNTARASKKQEILDEAWAQVKAHLALAGAGAVSDSDRVGVFIDTAIQFDAAGNVLGNEEPLLINTTDSRRHRPQAVTNVPNFFVAADYVLTETDLACMEAANEAARAAVNGVLLRSGSTATPCEIKPLEEPEVFRAFQRIDDDDYTSNPSRPPLLCRFLDQLLPQAGIIATPPSPLPWPLIIGGANLALLLLILYLLLKS
jgi:hypothetical protein